MATAIHSPPKALPPTGSAPRRPSWRQRFRLPRHLRITREGKYYIGITFGVGLVAVNTGNNLLYLLLGTLLALIVVSGILSELSLRHLRIERRLPRRAQVGRPHIVEIEVRNDKRRVPSYAIEVEDLRLHQSADKRCFFLKVSPQSVQVAAYRRTPARRGLERHSGFRVATRFPFGFFEKSMEIQFSSELVIYPAVDPVRLRPEPADIGLGGSESLGRGHGDEIMGLRPMRDGDDPRDIYWRRSTTQDHQVIRERVRDTRRTIDLVIDTVPDSPVPSPSWSDGFERRIREVASASLAHLRRGNNVVLHSSSGDRILTTPSRGPDTLLTFLALLTPTVARHDSQRNSLRPRRVESTPEPPAWAGGRSEGGERL
jgi:uncharacterized protein (DUF58 family)